MSLKAIDISSHQSVETAGMDGIDAVIVKTTQGTGYVNPKGDQQYQLAKSKGRLLGFYHYASGIDPVAEANNFYNNSKNYFKEAIPFLDWEAGDNAAWGNPNWCRAFVNRIHDLTGVWCGIYVQASAINQVANLSKDCPLWLAGYPTDAASWDVPDFMYSTAPWPSYTLWQFTSSGSTLDRNIVALDAAGWKRIANPSGGSTATKPTPKPPVSNGYSTSGKSLEVMAGDTVDGKTGVADARKNTLGKYYTGVQAIVNHRSNPNNAGSTVETLKKEVLNGVYGDGDERKRLLGSYYGPVQDAINGVSASGRSYTVVAGDTLSGIGQKLGVNWMDIAAANGIQPPYFINVGQVLKY